MTPLERRIRAVVFDLDDTLYPEIQYVRSGFRAAARQLARPGVGPSIEAVLDELLYAFRTGPRDRVFNTVLAQLGRPSDPETINELVQVYRTHRPDLRLDPAVARTLEELRERHKLAVLSDGYLPAQQYKLEALSLRGAFDFVLFTESLGRGFWKPHPRSFELTAEALGVPPEQCAYVADNPAKDFLAPNGLGWMTVEVNQAQRLQRKEPATPEHRAQHTISSPTELPRLLQG